MFFNMAKSFLNLNKECQVRSCDTLVAHAAVVCCRYIMLTLPNTMEKGSPNQNL